MGRRSTDPALPNCLACGAPNKRKSQGTKYCSRTCAGNSKHGRSNTTEYNIWRTMRQRCNCPGSREYPLYGARGIRVCDRWQDSFENFYADMGPRPAGLSLDRIDNNGNYEPGNCRWATRLEQSRNRSNAWTPEQDEQLRQALAEGLSLTQASELIGRQAGGRAWRLGLKTNYDPHALRGPNRRSA